MCEGGCEFPHDSEWSELDHPYYHAVIGTLVSMLHAYLLLYRFTVCVLTLY